MAEKVTICTADTRLHRKISLLLRGSYEPGEGGSIYIIDRDTSDVRRDGAIYLSRTESDCLRIPFLHSELVRLVAQSAVREELTLGENGEVRLMGRTVTLTDAEYRTLAVLMNAPKGEYVSRDRLLDEVFGEGTDPGSVNVYIYYLRRKLEKDGERIILSSRSEGYKINERYRR